MSNNPIDTAQLRALIDEVQRGPRDTLELVAYAIRDFAEAHKALAEAVRQLDAAITSQSQALQSELYQLRLDLGQALHQVAASAGAADTYSIAEALREISERMPPR